jgi:broad specificity phosphatase PhoE
VKDGAIYVVRHGQTAWNIAGRRQGRSDSPLTELGIAQAVAVGRALRRELGGADGVAIVCSPLGRARVTARIVCRELGLRDSAIAVDPLLAEYDQGEWEGFTAAEIEARFPGLQARRAAEKWSFSIPGGESYADAHARARRWLGAREETSPTIAVTHEMLSRTLLGAYAGETPEAMLARSHPHDRIFRMCGGAIEELRAQPMPASGRGEPA